MPRESKKRVEFADTSRPQQQFARITVGNVRAPSFQGQQIADRSPLEGLFEALGSLADGPVGTRLLAERDAREEKKALKAVEEGKTLDDIEDANFRTRAFYDGFMGKHRGMQMVAQYQQLLSENQNDPTWDPAAAASQLITEGFQNIENEDQAHNAAQYVRGTFDKLILAEEERRRKQAQIEIHDRARDTITQVARGIAQEGNYVDLHEWYETGREDLKHSPAFDQTNFKKWVASDLIAHAIEFKDPKLIRETAMQKNKTGGSLWTDPVVGPDLRKTYERLTSEKDSVNALEYGQALARMEKDLEDHERVQPETYAELVRVGVKDKTLGQIIKRDILAQDKVVEETRDYALLAASPEEAAEVGFNQERHATEMTDDEYNNVMNRGRKVLGESDPVKADQEIAVRESRYGRISSESKRRVTQGFNSHDAQSLKEAYELAKTYDVHNREAFYASIPEDTRNKYRVMNIFLSRKLGFEDFVKARGELAEGERNARELMKSAEASRAITEARNSHLPTYMASRHKDLTRYLLATGQFSDVADAAEAAAKELEGSLSKVGNLGSRLQIEAALVDARMGDQKFYNAFEARALDYLRDKRNFDDGGILDLGSEASAGERSLERRYDFWPRRDGSTWVYNEDKRLVFVIPTEPILEATLAIFDRVQDTKDRHAAEQAARDKATAERQLRLQQEARAKEKEHGIRILDLFSPSAEDKARTKDAGDTGPLF